MLIEKVRTASNVMHKQLDESMMPYISKIQSVESYGKLLSFFYAFYEPIYHNIEIFLPPNFLEDYALRRKPTALINDLHSLNINIPTHFCSNIPLISSGAAAVGALYVLEGSAMGGMVLKKIIAANLQANEQDAFNFFGFYGNKTAEKWRLFVDAVNTYPFSEPEQQLVIDTVNDTFKKLGNWLQENDKNMS